MPHQASFSPSARFTTRLTVPMTEFIKGMLEEHDSEPEFVQGNVLNPYVALYRQIKSQMEFIEIVKTEAERITSTG